MSGPPRSCSRARTTCGPTKAGRPVFAEPRGAMSERQFLRPSPDRSNNAQPAEHVGLIVPTLEHEGVIEIELLRLGVRWDVVRVGHFEHAPCLPAFDMRGELLEIEAGPREQEWR